MAKETTVIEPINADNWEKTLRENNLIADEKAAQEFKDKKLSEQQERVKHLGEIVPTNQPLIEASEYNDSPHEKFLKMQEEFKNKEEKEEVETAPPPVEVPGEQGETTQVNKAEYEKFTKERDELISRLTFYEEQRKLMESDPVGFFQQIAPSFFEKQKTVKEVLDEEFGANFLDEQYDAEEARKNPDSKSAQFDLRRFEIQLAQKNQKKGMEAGAIMQTREQIYNEGVPELNRVVEKAKKLGYTPEQIEKEVQAIAAKTKNNLIIASALAYEAKLDSDNKLAQEQKRLAAEEELLKSKKKVPVSPANTSTGRQPIKQKDATDYSEFMGLHAVGMKNK